MKLPIAALAAFTFMTANSQEKTDKNIHLTTGIGVNIVQGPLGNTFKSTIAFNSGFEKKNIFKLVCTA